MGSKYFSKLKYSFNNDENQESTFIIMFIFIPYQKVSIFKLV